MKSIPWKEFPDPPAPFAKLDLVEVKRVYDFEMPPLVVFAGVAEDREGRVYPVVGVVEEGTNYARLYVLERMEEAKKEELVSSLA